MSENLTNQQRKQLWADRIAAWQLSGKSGCAWCLEHNISYRKFIYWKAQFTHQKPLTSSCNTAFVELPPSTPDDIGIEVEYEGIRIHLTQTFDAATLERLIPVLKRSLCSP